MATVKDYQNNEDKKKQAFAYFTSKGYTPEMASGIVGNLIHESGLKTTIEGDKGFKGGSSFGIAQWRGERLDRLKNKYGKNWTDFKNQLEFVDWELNNTHKKAGDKLKQSNDIHDAGRIFSDYYEVPQKKYKDNTDRRLSVQRVASLIGQAKDPIDEPKLQEVTLPSELTTNVTNLPIAEKITTFAIKPEEKSFLQEYQSIFSTPQQSQEFVEEQPMYQPPQENLTDIFNKVSQFVDAPLAQQGKIFVESKEDPRYKAYNDSLYLYNQNKNTKETLLKDIKEKGGTNYFLVDIETNKNVKQDVTSREGENFEDLSYIKPTHYEEFTRKMPNYNYSIFNSNPEFIYVTNKLGQYKKPSQIIEVNGEQSIKQEIKPKSFLGEKQKSFGSMEKIENISPKIEEIKLTEAAKIPKSYDIEYIANRMNGGKGYYDGNNQEGVSYEVALRAVQQANSQNNYFENIYGSSKNTKAIERYKVLSDKAIITPNYQQGGNIGNLTQDQEIDIEKQREWLNNWNKNRVVNGQKINSNVEIPFSKNIFIDDLNYNNTSNSRNFGEFDPVSNRVLFDEKYTDKKGIPSHEFSHRFQKDFKSKNPQDYNSFVSEPINKYLKKAGNFTPYQLDPDETHSEINRLRYNEGYNPNQTINLEDLNNVNLKDYNFKQFSNEEIIDILNSTADINKVSDNSYAQQGGNFSKNELAFLKEFKNIPISSKGMYEYPNQPVIVPTNDGSITMKGIPHKIKAKSLETGEEKLLHPGKEYFFKNTKTVLEIPK